MKKLISSLLVLVLVMSLALPASAEDGNVTYVGSSRKFIFEPGSDYSPTDLFPNFKDVMPGDTITQRIYINNDVKNGVKIRVYMRALGAHPGSEEFLSQLGLEVVKVKDTLLFDAPADETAQLTKWTYLGTVYSGGEIELDVTLTVPVTLDNDFKNLVGYLDWEFMIEELPIEDSDPKPPKTGDEIMPYVYVLCASTLALVILFLVYKKKKKKNSAD